MYWSVAPFRSAYRIDLSQNSSNLSLDVMSLGKITLVLLFGFSTVKPNPCLWPTGILAPPYVGWARVLRFPMCRSPIFRFISAVAVSYHCVSGQSNLQKYTTDDIVPPNWTSSQVKCCPSGTEFDGQGCILGIPICPDGSARDGNKCICTRSHPVMLHMTNLKLTPGVDPLLKSIN